MNIRSTGMALVLSAALCGCSTKLTIDAPYKEIMVVYGLLDQKDTATYVKVNKAYLGVGNAYSMAQIYDSVNYPNIITVQLQQISGSTGNLVNTITLSRDSSVPKPSGTFSAPVQILYKTKTPLDSSCTYNLLITDNKTHNTVTGSTQLISGFSVTQPFESGGYLNFANSALPLRIAWNCAQNGVVYTITLRFYYYELNLTTHVTTKKHLDWIMPNQIAPQGSAGLPMFITINGPSFYQFLESELSPLNSNTNRYVGNPGASDTTSIVDLIFDIGTQDLNTYISVSQPTNSITQNQPSFSDILPAKTGYGLFTARFHTVMTPNFLSPSSLDSLYFGAQTNALFSGSYY